MLIDKFAEGWLNELDARAGRLDPAHRMILLIDGVFVPKLHRSVKEDQKALLFEALPGCTDETKDVSPFLTPYDPANRAVRALLQRCERWPMVSVIETPESIDQLSDRLAAWCVVEVDDQRFNFRFPDTRRLPAIFWCLDETQRAQFAGPAVRWTYISRNGDWCELEVVPAAADIVIDPVLSERQFAMLIDDSRADELLTLLNDRGQDVFSQPSRSYASVTMALRAAGDSKLADNKLVDWCEWYWQKRQLGDSASAAGMLKSCS